MGAVRRRQPVSLDGELLGGAGAPAGGDRLLNWRAVLLRYRKARWPAGGLLICGLLAGFALLFAGLWWNAMMVHGPLAQPMWLANGIAIDLLLGLSLTVLPQLYPDGPLPGRLWRVTLGLSAGLVVIATLKNQYDFRTALDLAEWYCDDAERVELTVRSDVVA